MNFAAKLNEIARTITGIKRDTETPREQRAKKLAEAKALKELYEAEQELAEHQAKIDALIAAAQKQFDDAEVKAKRTKATAKQVEALTDKANNLLVDLVDTLETLASLGEMGIYGDGSFYSAWQNAAKSQAVKSMVHVDMTHRPFFDGFKPLTAKGAKQVAWADRDLAEAKANLENVKRNANDIIEAQEQPEPTPEQEKKALHQEVNIRVGTQIDDVDPAKPYNHTSGKPSNLV